MSEYHIPVMLHEAVDAMQIKSDGVYVDMTFGGGSHTRKMLESNESARVFSFDQDDAAIVNAEAVSRDFGDRFTFIKSNFSNLRTELSLLRVKRIDGILFDLGVSSYQIDTPEKGFSFQYNGRLDMRMDQSCGETAEEVVNSYKLDELVKIFREYGEEKEAYRIAKAIVNKRTDKPIADTDRLAMIIDEAVKSRMKQKAKARIFQALRIHVNGELDVLKTALRDSVYILNPEARIVVISYHSLEDRIVKKFFQHEKKDCLCPSTFPECRCSKEQTLKIITNKPLLPTEEEISVNARARSAKMRVAQKI